MAKDRLGNKLEIGDLVEVQVANPANQTQSIPLVGEITDIQEGGTIIPGGQNLHKHPQQVQVTPGVVTISMVTRLAYDPRQGEFLAGVLKVVNPSPPAEGREAKGKTGLLAN